MSHTYAGSCGQGTVAYAAQCQSDDIGRPTVGFMNWCADAEMELLEAKLQSHVETGAHEVRSCGNTI